jgi:hypothetical protein
MTTLSFVLWVVAHSQSRGALDIAVRDAGVVNVRVELSMLDVPELCDAPEGTREVDDRVRGCVVRAIESGMHMSTVERCTWGTVDVQQRGADLHATSTLSCAPGARMSVDWGVFAATSLQHVAVARATVGDKVFETILSKQRTKWEFALPQPPKKPAASTWIVAVVVIFVALALAIYFQRMRKRSPRSVA